MHTETADDMQALIAYKDHDYLFSQIIDAIETYGGRVTNQGLQVPDVFMLGLYGPVTLVDARYGFDADDGYREIRKQGLLEACRTARSLIFVPFGESGVRIASGRHGTAHALHLASRCHEGATIIFLVRDKGVKSWCEAALEGFGKGIKVVEYLGSPGVVRVTKGDI
jgi:hypothetical protein